MSAATGQRLPPAIGRYEILSQLGQGGMARVFLAIQRGAFASEKLVVIKQLRPELVSDETFLTMFMDEARIALQLHHPNVVHTYEVGSEGGDYFLAMEFLEGLTLSQIIRKAGREGLPLNLHLWILSQVLAGLSYAHELRALDGEALGIVHRDVTPSNVMITSSGEVKLLDFGIAKAAGALSLTQQGVIKGKLGYVAPEQCMGRPSDARADLFAVGVMLWEAIAERRRVTGETSAAAFEARIRNREPAIEEVVPTVAPRLAEICARALAHDPSQRYPSAAEFRTDLEDFLDSNYSRVGASQLAAQMVQLFTEDFTALRMRIERHVQEHRRPAASERVPRARESEPATHIAETSLKPKRGQLAIGVVVGAVAVAGLAFALRGSSPPATTRAPAPSAAALALPGPSTPPASAPTSLVRISIVAFPKHAEILLDGRRVENPFNQQLQADSGPHRLEVSAEGYQGSEQSVSFERDLQLVVELRKERGSAPRVGRAAASRAEKQGAHGNPQPRAEAPAAPLPAASPPRSSDSAPQPGQDLKNSARVPRSIDEKDLYK